MSHSPKLELDAFSDPCCLPSTIPLNKLPNPSPSPASRDLSGPCGGGGLERGQMHWSGGGGQERGKEQAEARGAGMGWRQEAIAANT